MPLTPDQRHRLHRRFLKQLSGAAPDQQPPEIVPLDYGHGELYLYVTSKVERTSRAFSCRKEPATVSWLEALAPGEVLYDIGANVGAYSLIAASRVGPAGRVVAFEPSYASFAHLCDNIVLNGMSDIVLPVPVPLGEKTMISTLNYHRLVPGHARHAVGEDAADARGDVPVYRQPVLLTRLDDLVAQFALPVPRFIKIDVDGAEAGVLRGARQTLAQPGLRELMIEVDVQNTDAVLEVMTGAGFRLADRYDRTREDGTPAPLWYGRFSRP
jgi:FkbM family methyltransferase